MVLKENNNDKCTWDFRGDEVTCPIVNFALCHDCPMCIDLKLEGKASDKKTHSVEVRCERELKNKKLNLIVPTLGKRIKELKRLIESIEKQEIRNYYSVTVLVISQNNHKKVNKILNNVPSPQLDIIHQRINEKGISIAKNKGLELIGKGIVGFPDDDAWLPKGSINTILDHFNEYDEEISCFQYYDPNKEKGKDYPKESKSLDSTDIMSVSGIEIFANMNKIDLPKFHENFGLGSENPIGGELLWLKTALENDYSINYHPKRVFYHPYKEESKLNEKRYKSKLVMFQEAYGMSRGFVYFIALTILKYNKIESLKEGFVENIKKSWKWYR